MAQLSPTRASSPRSGAGDASPFAPVESQPKQERKHTWENTYITKPEGYGEARARHTVFALG